jgi:hypothetical protein
MAALQIVVTMQRRMMTSAVVALETDRTEGSIIPAELADPEGLLHNILSLLSEEEMEEEETAAAAMGIMG